MKTGGVKLVTVVFFRSVFCLLQDYAARGVQSKTGPCKKNKTIQDNEERSSIAQENVGQRITVYVSTG
jgi:hypothetical protein